MMNKREYRSLIRSRHVGESARAEQNKRICEHILASEIYQNAAVIAGYIPLKWEADITPVLEDALRRGKTLALPLCGPAPEMTFRRVTALSELVPGAYGIPEPPAHSHEITLTAEDLILVPLEGIDDSGTRLGKGGGYYDCLLREQQVPAMGCALAWQCVRELPKDPWDVALKMCVTPNGVRYY